MAGLHPSLWVPSWEGQPCREEGGWQAQRSGTLSCHPLFGTLWLTASFLRPCPPCPCPPRADVRGWGGRWTAQLGQGQALPSTKQPSVFPSPASPAVSLSLSLSPRQEMRDRARASARRSRLPEESRAQPPQPGLRASPGPTPGG